MCRPEAAMTLVNYPIEGPISRGRTSSLHLRDGELQHTGDRRQSRRAAEGQVSLDGRDRLLLSGADGGGVVPWPDEPSMADPADRAVTTRRSRNRCLTSIAWKAAPSIESFIKPPSCTTRLPSRGRNGHKPRQKNWNGRLVYTFGGGCLNGWYRQGSGHGRRDKTTSCCRSGYAMASSSLNVFGNNCQDVTGGRNDDDGEGALHRGLRPRRGTRMGWGCSGGSYAQHQIADNYPGLLDGIIPGRCVPRGRLRRRSMFITDAWLLDNYFVTRRRLMGWTDEQKRQVTGFMALATRPRSRIGAGRIDPGEGSPRCRCPRRCPTTR